MLLRHNLRGCRVAVVGGLGLIGEAITAAMADLGATVLVLDNDEGRWTTRELEIQAGGRDIEFAAFDAAATDGVADRVGAVEAGFGPIDAWVNSAYPRTADWATGVEDVTADSWRQNVDMQLNAVCLTCNAVAARMAARGGGAIINISSIYGCGGPDFHVYDRTSMSMPPAYAAIKAGINNYTRYLASYWGGRGVRVNAICPGGVFDEQPDAFVHAYESRTPLGRMANAAEIAGPVAFLATDAAAYITGAIIPVDGGWTAI